MYTPSSSEFILKIRQATRQLLREWRNLRPNRFSNTHSQALLELGSRGKLNGQELAVVLGMDKSSSSRILAAFRKKGLLVQKEVPEDKRQKAFSLSPTGKSELDLINQTVDLEIYQAMRLLSVSEREEVAEGLELFLKGLKLSKQQRRINLRDIQEKDDPAMENIIVSVMTEYGAVGDGYSIEDEEVKTMSRHYQGSRKAFFVVERGRKLLGGAGIAPLKGGDGKTCELRKMYVLPEARGFGLGRLLLQECLNFALDKGYKRCYLETISGMKEAGQLYQKYGFQALDAPMGETGHHSCESYYVLDL